MKLTYKISYNSLLLSGLYSLWFMLVVLVLEFGAKLVSFCVVYLHCWCEFKYKPFN